MRLGQVEKFQNNCMKIKNGMKIYAIYKNVK